MQAIMLHTFRWDLSRQGIPVIEGGQGVDVPLNTRSLSLVSAVALSCANAVHGVASVHAIWVSKAKLEYYDL